ncbi:MAG: molecular chaperone TorD family protein [Chloroflexota bacterium]
MNNVSIYAILADALQYPYPGLAGKLQVDLHDLPHNPARVALQAFVQTVQRLNLGEWEELYTRTLDLNPAVAPYIGYQMWGDGYPRGSFMAALNRAYHAAGVEVDGELPDHLGAVLTYLSTGAPPPPELVENFHPALEKMTTTLRKAEAHNPYLLLLEATAQTVDFEAVYQARGAYHASN